MGGGLRAGGDPVDGALRGFAANIAVLLGIIGCPGGGGLGKMSFEKVAKALWWTVTPLAFGMPSFDPRLMIPDDDAVDDRRDDRIDRRSWRSEITAKVSTAARSARACAPTAWHLDRRPVQHLPLHQLLPERRSGWASPASKQPLGVRGGGLIMLMLGLLPKMAAFSQSLASCRRRGSGDTWKRLPPPACASPQCRLQDQPQQLLHRRDSIGSG